MIITNLKETRIKVGLNQRELAEKVHMSQSLISDFERGTRKVYRSAAARLSDALGVPVDELFPEDKG